MQPGVLNVLNGESISNRLVAPITWGCEYIWKVTPLKPWELSLGGTRKTWHQAYCAFLKRHPVDALFYQGAGGVGNLECEVIKEDDRSVFLWNPNDNQEYEFVKESFSLRYAEAGRSRFNHKTENKMLSKEDVDRFFAEQEPKKYDTYIAELECLINQFGNQTLILPRYSPAFIFAAYTFGFERAMITMAQKPELFFYVADIYASRERDHFNKLRSAGAQAIYVADSWASCDILSPEFYNKFAYPYQEGIAKRAHEAGLKIILWSTGNILPLLSKMKSLPIDALAVEQSRKNVDIDIGKVRKIWGKERCLWGNLDSETLLVKGHSAEIRAEVKRQYDIAGDGPFILSTGSPLSNNVEPKAVDVMIEAGHAF